MSAGAAALIDAQATERILQFLRQIGLEVREELLPGDCFLPGIRIVQGGLVVDRLQLRWPGDLLHEAGHLAVVPAALRPRMDDALAQLPAIEHGGEIEATAWAWAAPTHLQLPSQVLFHEGGYRGHAAGLRINFEMGIYLGASGLVHAGLAWLPGPDLAVGAPIYPRLRQWLRD
ncbi:hypothetical protein ABE501_09240 [Comamonas testosteroni]